MDLNELHFRHQLSLMHAAGSAAGGERSRHNAAADCLAERIGSIQRDVGALAAPLLPAPLLPAPLLPEIVR